MYRRIRVSAGVSLGIIVTFLCFLTATPLLYASPSAIFLDGYGVVTFDTSSGNPGEAVKHYYEASISVTDLDGITSTSHTVTIKTPGGVEYTLEYDASQSGATTATYYKLIGPLASYESGTFTFTVTDPGGVKATLTDTLTVDPSFPVPNVNSFSPQANTVVSNTTPTMTWSPVAGAQNYQVRIYTADGSKTVWTGSSGHQTSYTVPPDILAPNTTYRYRIAARKVGGDPFNIDNVSAAPDSPASSVPFTTGGVWTDIPIISLRDGVATYSSIGGVHPTRLNFNILVSDVQGVPGNIRSVSVKFPGGREERLYYDIGNGENISTRGIYTSAPDLTPEAGSYTFTATDREGHTYSISEELTVQSIGYPALTSLQPAMNAFMTDTAVNFAWNAVTGAAFYRLRIYGADYKPVLTRNVPQPMNPTVISYSLPAGFLKAGSLYRYDITTYREFADDGIDNFSVTRWSGSDMPTFVTGPVTVGTSSPAIDLNNIGVYTDQMADPRTPGNSLYALNFYAKITNPDGVPGNIASVAVSYPGGGGTILRLDSVISATQAEYFKSEMFANPDSIPQGTYTFTVTARNNNSATATDSLVKNVFPPPTNLNPASGAIVGTTPTITWDAVPNASYYMVYLYSWWDGAFYVYPISGVLTATTVTVPAGLLQTNATYGYTVYAFRDPVNQNLNNRSVSDYRSLTERTHFSTSPKGDVSGNGGVVGLEDAIVALQVMARKSPRASKDADVNQDGKIGLQEAIYILQLLSGLR